MPKKPHLNFASGTSYGQKIGYFRPIWGPERPPFRGLSEKFATCARPAHLARRYRKKILGRKLGIDRIIIKKKSAEIGRSVSRYNFINIGGPERGGSPGGGGLDPPFSGGVS